MPESNQKQKYENQKNEMCQIVLFSKFGSRGLLLLPPLDNLDKNVWDVALILTPFVVLAFHVYFWRRVCLIYDSIDISKVIIRADVWSYKV